MLNLFVVLLIYADTTWLSVQNFSATVPRFNFFLIKYGICTGNTAAVNSSLGIDKNLNRRTTSILHRYVKDQILMNFHVISTYFFNVILMIEKSTSFFLQFFDVISMLKKSTSFRHTFFVVI